MISLKKNLIWLCAIFVILSVLFFMVSFYIDVRSYMTYSKISVVQQVFGSIKDYGDKVQFFLEKEGVCPSYDDQIKQHNTDYIVVKAKNKKCIIVAKTKETSELASAIRGKLIVLEFEIGNKQIINTRCYTSIGKEVFEAMFSNSYPQPNFEKPRFISDCKTEVPEDIKMLIN